MASTGTNMAQSNPDLQKAVKYCPACSIIVFPAKRRGDSVAVTCRWPNSMTKMQLTMQTMCLQLKPAAAVVPHFRQEVENDR